VRESAERVQSFDSSHAGYCSTASQRADATRRAGPPTRHTTRHTSHDAAQLASLKAPTNRRDGGHLNKARRTRSSTGYAQSIGSAYADRPCTSPPPRSVLSPSCSACAPITTAIPPICRSCTIQHTHAMRDRGPRTDDDRVGTARTERTKDLWPVCRLGASQLNIILIILVAEDHGRPSLYYAL
jgi:hypothetical protein